LKLKIYTNHQQDLIRVSVGTEHIDDIIADFEQSFAAAGSALDGSGHEENATKKAKTDHEVTTSL
jgi:O-acetylhomoserine/O-acetylserine sulfhydrylase